MTARCDHAVHVHTDRGFLMESVAAYLRAGIERGEGGIVIARPELREALGRRIAGLRMLDAEETLARFMRDGRPDWHAFSEVVGDEIAALSATHPAVRAYGEMVDILWQRGERDAAISLEEFWNELGRMHEFSLLCAYHLSDLEDLNSLERICAVHTRFISARDPAPLDAAVAVAAQDVLQQPLYGIVDSLAGKQRPDADMSAAHAMLLWLNRNMPRTAAQVLDRVRDRMVAQPA